MESTSQRVDTFGVLPPELRNEVYKNLLTSPDPVPFVDCHGLHPAILRVNKLYSAEAVVILYRKNTILITVDDYEFPSKVISTLPISSRNLIESIEISSEIYELLIAMLRYRQSSNQWYSQLERLTLRASIHAMGMYGCEGGVEDLHRKGFCARAGVSMSKRQWRELRDSSNDYKLNDNLETEAPMFSYLLQCALERFVELLPRLQSLELAGVLDNAKFRAVQQVKGRIFDKNGDWVPEETVEEIKDETEDDTEDETLDDTEDGTEDEIKEEDQQ